MFQKSLKKYSKNYGPFSSIKDKFKDKFKKFKAWGRDKWESFKELKQDIKDKIEELAIPLINKFMQYLPENVRNIIMDCAKPTVKIALGVKNIIMGIIAKINTIAAIAGGAYPLALGLVFDLICNSNLFVKAFESLRDAIKENDDIIRKYTLIGNFLGYAIKAITN